MYANISVIIYIQKFFDVIEFYEIDLLNTDQPDDQEPQVAS